jgi:hypothetical protein
MIAQQFIFEASGKFDNPAQAILERCKQSGVQLRVEGTRLKAKGSSESISAWKALIQRHKPEIVAELAEQHYKNNIDINQYITSWRWLVHCPDRDIEISTIPESSLAQVLLDFPTAISAEPILDTPKRKATCSETTELTELVDLIYANDADADRAEALAAALADPDDALTCYLAMQNALQTPKAASSLSDNTFASSSPNECSTAHPSEWTV